MISSTDEELIQLFTSRRLGIYPCELSNGLDKMGIMQHTFSMGSQGGKVFYSVGVSIQGRALGKIQENT